MATQLFLVSGGQGHSGIQRGTNTNNLAGTATGWDASLLLRTTRGTSLVTVATNTITGTTPGIECGTPTPYEFISLPLAAAVTISGTITINTWALENSMTANVAINCYIDRIDDEGAIISRIATSARVIETGTAAAAENFTVTPTSTVMNKGDRIRVVMFGDDVGGMASGFTFTLNFSGPTAAANADTYVTFTENMTFQTTAPSGSQLFLTSAAGPAVGANDEREMWTSRGGGSTTAVRNTATGWTAPLQWTASAGGTAIEWYSRPLNAFTLAGLVRVNLRVQTSSISAHIGVRAEIAVCNIDGSSAVVWGANNIVDTPSVGGINPLTANNYWGDLNITTNDVPIRGWLAGSDTAVTDGQRIRLRVFIDDPSDQAMATGFTGTLSYNGASANVAGDTWIQLPQAVTEYIPPAITVASYRFYDSGTETGAIALAAQDTALIGNIRSGDGIGQLRMRLQSTNAGAIAATSDWQLQWEKNASGTWTNVAAYALVDGADEVGSTTISIGAAAADQGSGQSFTGNGQLLTRARFKLGKQVGSPTHSLVARLYAHTGTFGTSSVPTGAVLATSTNTVSASTLSASPGLMVNFDFDGTYTLVNGTKYCIVVFSGDGGTTASVSAALFQTANHAGNRIRQTGVSSFVADAPTDLTFGVYSPITNSVVPYNDPSLTEAAPTTNRLGAGTGSFVAGKISKMGDVQNFGWTATYYTELLVPVAVKATDVIPGDVIRFRLTRNGSTSEMTYTQVPTINVISGPIDYPATIADNWGTWTATGEWSFEPGIVMRPFP